MRTHRAIRIAAIAAAGAMLAACGARATPSSDRAQNGSTSTSGPAARGSTTSPPASLASTTEGRRTLARRDARYLLGLLRLPAGSQYVAGEPAGDGGVLKTAPQVVGQSTSVMMHRFAVVPGRPEQVRDWFVAHGPTGSSHAGTGSSGRWNVMYAWEATFTWPAIGQVLNLRGMSVETVRLPGLDRTGLRIDVQVGWLPPKPAADIVSPDAGYLVADLTAEMNPGQPGAAHVTTTDRQTIAAIIHRIDKASVLTPGAAVSCPADFGGTLVLSFAKSRDDAPYDTVKIRTSGCLWMQVIQDRRPVSPGLEGWGLGALFERWLKMHPKPVVASTTTS